MYAQFMIIYRYKISNVMEVYKSLKCYSWEGFLIVCQFAGAAAFLGNASLLQIIYIFILNIYRNGQFGDPRQINFKIKILSLSISLLATIKRQFHLRAQREMILSFYRSEEVQVQRYNLNFEINLSQVFKLAGSSSKNFPYFVKN